MHACVHACFRLCLAELLVFSICRVVAVGADTGGVTKVAKPVNPSNAPCTAPPADASRLGLNRFQQDESLLKNVVDEITRHVSNGKGCWRRQWDLARRACLETYTVDIGICLCCLCVFPSSFPLFFFFQARLPLSVVAPKALGHRG